MTAKLPRECPRCEKVGARTWVEGVGWVHNPCLTAAERLLLYPPKVRLPSRAAPLVGRPQIWREWFGVQPAPAQLIEALYAADGGPVCLTMIMTATDQTRNGALTSLKKARDAMDDGSILRASTDHYFLTAVGVADCEAALADAQQRRAA